jgi:hypothetical protein
MTDAVIDRPRADGFELIEKLCVAQSRRSLSATAP